MHIEQSRYELFQRHVELLQSRQQELDRRLQWLEESERSLVNEMEVISFESQLERLELENKQLKRALCELGRLLNRD